MQLPIIMVKSIPDGWDGFEMTRLYRGKRCRVAVKGNQGRLRQLVINGQPIQGNFMPYTLIKDMDTLENLQYKRLKGG